MAPPFRQSRRNLIIAAGVVLLHAAALWALQSGRVLRPSTLVVPVTIVSEQVTPPAPLEKAAPSAPEPKRPAPPPPRTPLPPKPAQAPLAKPAPKPAAAPAQTAAPVPPAPTPSLNAPALPSVDAPAAAPMAGAPTNSDSAGASGVPGPASTGSGVELPSSGAGYLQNPAPVYPAISKRLGEQGKVLVRVLIGADGNPQTAEIKRSSGFDRLDRSALEYVMKCRYVPGKVGGAPRAMWYEAPVSFVLE